MARTKWAEDGVAGVHPPGGPHPEGVPRAVTGA